ncbi:MAG: sigma-54-dependent Fis family transcriptional regulator [Magnetospirillum gryphiswaldense]|nr:sigma-54-dependent Fis family transcriptional regulator [Magnetospirillum gryphiswaldense]
MKPRILVVDDDPYTRTLFEGILRNRDIDLALAADGSQARRLFADSDFNLVVMDQRLPDANGLELVQEFRHARPQQVAVLVTGYADAREAVRAVRAGLFDYLIKPFENLEELEAVLDKALEVDAAYRELAALRQAVAAQNAGGMIGTSHAMNRLLESIRQVAPLDTTVLIEGESGTGKELVARLIHAASGRSPRRFLAINCGALSEPLLESALFGFEKGAFTGAVRTTPGYFEEAHGGTLFLDEVADMSPRLQSSLLRLLQERTFHRLGSTQSRQSDFRLVCATNKPLAEEVRAGRFREDLFYRVNVVSLRTPPLRERREDIPLLAQHFLDLLNAKFGKAVGPFTPGALKHLAGQPWPGNVRQLQHAIERVVALKSESDIDEGDFAHLDDGRVGDEDPEAVLPYHQARESFERHYLRRLFDAAQGNISEAARLSGISRQNLYVRMKRWDIVAE